MNSERVRECTSLAGEILQDIELDRIPLKSIILKGLRLCRILGDDTGVKLFTYESSGYPGNSNGYLHADAWVIAELARRRYWKKEGTQTKEYALTALVAEMEDMSVALVERLKVAKDPSSYGDNMTPHMINVAKNANERITITTQLRDNTQLIQKVRGAIYNYVLNIYNKLKYGNVIEDVFTARRLAVNDKLAVLCPEAINKFVSVYDNMNSENPEDWANAVHSCRRIIKDVADKLYPPPLMYLFK